MNTAKYYPDLFKARHKNLRGKKWLRSIPWDERKDFARLGLMHACEKTEYQIWSMGGRARAQTAERDDKGRFKRG
jgi:hypothetical protein